MRMDLESNIKSFLKSYKAFVAKDIPYATMVATNNIAFDAQKALRNDVKNHLRIKVQRSFTAWRVRKATKRRPYAELYVDRWSWQYYALIQHYKGGDRHRKGMEKAMIYAGLMYRWEILTPPPGVRIYPYTYVEMMAQLKLNYKAGFMANETKKSRERREKLRGKGVRYFVITGKSASPLAPGVYARVPGVPRPVCMLRISEKPEYRKRMDDEAVVRKVLARRGQKTVDEAFARAMAIRKARGW